MPTIIVDRGDLERLLGAAVAREALERELELAKAEVKGYDDASGEFKIELRLNKVDTFQLVTFGAELYIPDGLKGEYPLF